MVRPSCRSALPHRVPDWSSRVHRRPRRQRRDPGLPVLPTLRPSRAVCLADSRSRRRTCRTCCAFQQPQPPGYRGAEVCGHQDGSFSAGLLSAHRQGLNQLCVSSQTTRPCAFKSRSVANSSSTRVGDNLQPKRRTSSRRRSTSPARMRGYLSSPAFLSDLAMLTCFSIKPCSRAAFAATSRTSL